MSGEAALLLGTRITNCTADAFASARQIDAAFEAAIAEIAAARPSFEKIAGIIVCLDLFHPAMNIPSRRPSGSFSKIDSKFYCQASIDYPAFASGGWAGCSSAYVDAAVRAVGAIHKTRLGDAERRLVIDVLREAQAATTPPADLALLDPALVSSDEKGGVQQIWFAESSGPILDDAVAVAPEDAMTLAVAAASAIPKVQAFSLYRSVDGQRHYHEAWPVEGGVIENRGRCGERGDARHHDTVDESEQVRILAEMSKAARMAGFRTLPLSRQSTVEVVAAIDGFGDVAATDRRHALEDLLNEQLGWLGLGYCDGGSTGSGSTEVFCIVPDAPTARRLLPQILADGGFSEFQVRR